MSRKRRDHRVSDAQPAVVVNEALFDKLRRAAESIGHGNPSVPMGYVVKDNRQVRKRNQKALAVLEQGAAAGVAGASYNLAELLYNGAHGISPDLARTFQLYVATLKASLGDGPAACREMFSGQHAMRRAEGVTVDVSPWCTWACNVLEVTDILLRNQETLDSIKFEAGIEALRSMSKDVRVVWRGRFSPWSSAAT